MSRANSDHGGIRPGPLPAQPGIPSRGEAGSPNGSERHCSRAINNIVGPGEVLCNKPATHHIIWEDGGPGGVESGWACEDHAAEVRERWTPVGMHTTGAHCGMPGSLWHPPSDQCIAGDIPTAEPVRVVAAEEVPVGAPMGPRAARLDLRFLPASGQGTIPQSVGTSAPAAAAERAGRSSASTAGGAP